MKQSAENRKRKRSSKIARPRFSRIGVRWQVWVIRVIMLRDARGPRPNHRTSLVPHVKSNVDGSFARNAQRPGGEAKDYCLRDPVGSVAGRHRSFDLLRDNRAGDT